MNSHRRGLSASGSVATAALFGLIAACSSDPSPDSPTGGTSSLGGATTTGGTPTASGGSSTSGGATATSGGASSGGAVTQGGMSSGGATSGGATATTGGATATTGGGTATSGGATATSGGATSGGAKSTGGAPATGGAGGGGQTGTGGSKSTGGSGGGSGTLFSFFMTSQAGLVRLANNEKGFGGDLRFGKADGLSGADEICRQLAESSLPGNGKTWRAFLSVTKGPSGAQVNAIDRVGEGPWYDRIGRLVTMNKAGLLQVRPQGADAAIAQDLPNEMGVPNHNPGTGIIDNHNTLTGSTAMGTLDAQGLNATCQDWTSSASSGGKPRCGVSWPRGNLTNWISTLNESGCAPGTTPAGADSGPQGTVGGLGGYGGFYCFALTP